PQLPRERGLRRANLAHAADARERERVKRRRRAVFRRQHYDRQHLRLRQELRRSSRWVPLARDGAGSKRAGDREPPAARRERRDPGPPRDVSTWLAPPEPSRVDDRRPAPTEDRARREPDEDACNAADVIAWVAPVESVAEGRAAEREPGDERSH